MTLPLAAGSPSNPSRRRRIRRICAALPSTPADELGLRNRVFDLALDSRGDKFAFNEYVDFDVGVVRFVGPTSRTTLGSDATVFGRRPPLTQ
jgi:hypothetical protein